MKPSFFFQHNWHVGKLVSAIRVEDLMESDHDMFALIALLDSEDNLPWYWFDPEHLFTGSDQDRVILDRNRAAYCIKTYYDRLKLERYHVGECVGINCLCTRCITETAYLRCFDLIKKSNVLSQGGITNLIALIIAYEEKYIQRQKYYDIYCKNMIEKDPTRSVHSEAMRLFPMPDGRLDSRIDHWDNIEPARQDYYKTRAVTFRRYFDKPELVADVQIK